MSKGRLLLFATLLVALFAIGFAGLAFANDPRITSTRAGLTMSRVEQQLSHPTGDDVRAREEADDKSELDDNGVEAENEVENEIENETESDNDNGVRGEFEPGDDREGQVQNAPANVVPERVEDRGQNRGSAVSSARRVENRTIAPTLTQPRDDRHGGSDSSGRCRSSGKSGKGGCH